MQSQWSDKCQDPRVAPHLQSLADLTFAYLVKTAISVGIPVATGLATVPFDMMDEVDDVVPAGDSFRVTLRVLGATTVHLISMPSAKDVFEYRRGFARLLDLPFGRQEVSINIASAAALYKKLATSTEGYVGDVPIIHQAVAVKAANDGMDAAVAEDRDATF